VMSEALNKRGVTGRHPVALRVDVRDIGGWLCS
jgi:hypothetical protein